MVHLLLTWSNPSTIHTYYWPTYWVWSQEEIFVCLFKNKWNPYQIFWWDSTVFSMGVWMLYDSNISCWVPLTSSNPLIVISNPLSDQCWWTMKGCLQEASSLVWVRKKRPVRGSKSSWQAGLVLRCTVAMPWSVRGTGGGVVCPSTSNIFLACKQRENNVCDPATFLPANSYPWSTPCFLIMSVPNSSHPPPNHSLPRRLSPDLCFCIKHWWDEARDDG